MALAPHQQYMYAGIFLWLLAAIFLISALAVPKFGVVTASVVGFEVSQTIGAFQFCVSAAGGLLNSCLGIDSSCTLTGDYPSGGGSSGGGGQQTSLTMPYCGTFNAFRGFLVTSLVFGGLALLASLAYACTAKPNPNIAHFTFIASLLAAVTAAISLVCWVSFGNATYDDAMAEASASGGVGEVTTGHGASFYLLVSALVAVLLGLLIWLYGVHQKRLSGGEGGQPHYHSAPANYSADQLNQPLTQH